MEVGLTMGGVGFLLPPPDIISSVISLPPWFGSRIRIVFFSLFAGGSCCCCVGTMMGADWYTG